MGKSAGELPNDPETDVQKLSEKYGHEWWFVEELPPVQPEEIPWYRRPDPVPDPKIALHNDKEPADAKT